MATVLSLMVLTVMALLGGAIFLFRRGGARRQVMLMLVLSGVIAVNIAIWVVPGAQDQAPVARLPR